MIARNMQAGDIVLDAHSVKLLVAINRAFLSSLVSLCWLSLDSGSRCSTVDELRHVDERLLGEVLT